MNVSSVHVDYMCKWKYMSSGKKLILRIVGTLVIIFFVALVSYELGQRDAQYPSLRLKNGARVYEKVSPSVPSAKRISHDKVILRKLCARSVRYLR